LTPKLHHAAKYGHDKVVQILVAVNVILRSRIMMVGRHYKYATKYGYNEIIEMLVAANSARDEAKNNNS